MAQRLNVEKCGVVDLYDLSLISGGKIQETEIKEEEKRRKKREKIKIKKKRKEEVGGGRWRTTREKLKGTPFLMG